MREGMDVGDSLLEGFGAGDGGMMDIGEMPQVSDLTLDQAPGNQEENNREPTPMDVDQANEQPTSESNTHQCTPYVPYINSSEHYCIVLTSVPFTCVHNF